MISSNPDSFDLEQFYREHPVARESAGCLNASAFHLRPGTEARRCLVQVIAAASALARQLGGTLDLATLLAALKIDEQELATVEREIRAETGGGGVH